MTERLRRLDYVFSRRPVYFVTACTNRRQPLLANDGVRRAVEDFAQAGPPRGAWLGAYVLMPDHWHGFVVLDDSQISLSAWMRAFKGVISQHLRGRDFPAPHWQKGFFDHVLRSGQSATEKWNYVRENPVRAKLVATADEWPYWGQPFPAEFRAEA